jgi:hypothetical protein
MDWRSRIVSQFRVETRAPCGLCGVQVLLAVIVEVGSEPFGAAELELTGDVGQVDAGVIRTFEGDRTASAIAWAVIPPNWTIAPSKAVAWPPAIERMGDLAGRTASRARFDRSAPPKREAGKKVDSRASYRAFSISSSRR